MPSGRSYPSSMMSSTLHSSSFLSLPREIRDNIYETLLYAPIGTPSPSIPVHLIEDLNSYSYSPDLMFDWNWQTEHAPRGSCFGILYTCRQIYTEIVECFERQEKLGGMSFELDIILRGVVLDYDRGWNLVNWGDEIWPTWTVLPLCTYPQGFDGSSLIATDRHPKCKTLEVSLRVQSEMALRWSDPDLLERLTRSLFTMLARFLLYGPAGFCKITNPDHRVWKIDTLSINLSRVTSFTDPYNGQTCTVPDEVVEDSITHLKNYLDEAHTAGALFDRIRLVRLSLEGVLDTEWLVDQGKTMSSLEKELWASRYGWVIDADSEERRISWHKLQKLNLYSRYPFS
ncbi:hypothetical protein C8R42DRAFT_653950 [Lentinula raphanica]|nr:hypothetical protein C8R42DRAFT_653950 [Lentinula raphanica]